MDGVRRPDGSVEHIYSETQPPKAKMTGDSKIANKLATKTTVLSGAMISKEGKARKFEDWTGKSLRDNFYIPV